MATKRFLALIAATLITFFLTFFVDRLFVLEPGAAPGPAHVAERTDLATGTRPTLFEPAT